LEPGRTISLETDEGSWISLDVSPDGETIVFDLLGDLYTLPLEGGEATRITRGMAYDGQPRYSPDGEKIVFVSDRSGGDNLWTLELATGDTAQITQGNGGRWVSPDWTPGRPKGPPVWGWCVSGWGTWREGAAPTCTRSRPTSRRWVRR
jgi:Tol biopolymer transport system component